MTVMLLSTAKYILSAMTAAEKSAPGKVQGRLVGVVISCDRSTRLNNNNDSDNASSPILTNLRVGTGFDQIWEWML
jgi:hypothetical protein